jgi:hypothetical protein
MRMTIILKYLNIDFISIFNKKIYSYIGVISNEKNII